MSVTDLATNGHNTFLATGSDDGIIEVHAIGPEDSLTLVCRLENAHPGSAIHSLSWAHSRFPGNLFATTGADRVLNVWKESGTMELSERWSVVHRHEFTTTVNCGVWGPHEFGIAIACALTDGTVHVLRSLDLRSWQVTHFLSHPGSECYSVSWAPFMAPSTLATLPITSATNHPTSAATNAVPVTTPQELLCTCGNERNVKIWKWIAPGAHWTLLNELRDSPFERLLDVAWAPNFGLPFTYIAAGAVGGVSVWHQDALEGKWMHQALRVDSGERTAASDCPNNNNDGGDRVFVHVTWSLIGTHLIASAADGSVVLWKENPSTGVWQATYQGSRKELEGHISSLSDAEK